MTPTECAVLRKAAALALSSADIAAQMGKGSKRLPSRLSYARRTAELTTLAFDLEGIAKKYEQKKEEAA